MINKAMFLEMQDIEHFKYNKLLEQFSKLLRDFSVKSGHVLTTTSTEFGLSDDFPEVLKSSKNFPKLMKKREELKKKHRNLSESLFVKELLMTEEELNNSNFYSSHPHLK